LKKLRLIVFVVAPNVTVSFVTSSLKNQSRSRRLLPRRQHRRPMEQTM